MPGTPPKNFNLPWHQHQQYWVIFHPRVGNFSARTLALLQNNRFHRMSDGAMALETDNSWKPIWDQVYAGLKQNDALGEVNTAVVPGPEYPANAMAECKPPVAVQAIAESLWLGDALLEGRVVCYLQAVVSGPDKIFGYESFARVKSPDGEIIGGDRIITASRALGIMHMIDRHLHVQAIKTFVSSQLTGFLFVNFFPGFIQRPSVYLEKLSETAKNYGLVSKHIVLDLTKAETPRDLAHLISICDYGRSRGYSIALDDISSLDGARKLVPEIKPDFVKLDMHLVQGVLELSKHDTIRNIVDLVHAAGGAVIAEGVETDDIYKALRQIGVDLFQGYLFSPPVSIEAVEKRSSGTA